MFELITPPLRRGLNHALVASALASSLFAQHQVHRKLTFRELPRVEQLNAEGIRSVALLSQNESIIASVPADFTVTSAPSLGGLESVELIHPEDKIDDPMRELLGSARDPITLVVRGYTDVDMAQFFLHVDNIADGEVRHHPNLPGNLVVVTASGEAFERMLELDTVDGFLEPTREVKEGRFTHYCPGGQTSYGAVRYDAPGDGWDGPGLGCASLTYHFVNGTTDIAGTGEREAVRQALLEWTNHADLFFTETSTPGLGRSIDFTWTTSGFTDPNATVGTGFVDSSVNDEPIAGDVLFNDTFTFSLSGETHMFSSALHEIGHGLGLGHSDDSGAVMSAFYNGIVTGLAPDDINGIQSLYSFDPSPWKHAVLDWDVTQVTDEIAVSRVSSSVYYNHDGRMFAFYWDDGDWQHSCLDWSVTNVAGDIVGDWDTAKVFYRGTNGRLWSFYHTDSGWMNAPLSWSVTNIAGDITPAQSDTSVYYRGTDDNSMYRFWWDGGWNHERMIDSVTNVAGDVATTNTSPNIYYRDFSGRMWAYYRESSGSWANAPLSWTVTNVAGDTATSSISNNVHYRGTDNRLWSFRWNSGWSNSPLRWDVTNVDANVVTCEDNDQSSVFYSDPEGRMWTLYYSGGAWENSILRWDVSSVLGPVAARTGRVYYRGTDNRMRTFYWSPETTCPRGVI